jgi:hypothetical protein
MGAAEQIRLPADLDQPVYHRDHMVRVTLDKDEKEQLVGRYNGKDYVFKPGKYVDIPIDAARHIFALGVKSQRLRAGSFNNLGLLARLGSFEKCEEFFKKFRFDEPPPLIELAADDPRLKRARRSAKKTSAASSSVVGSGEAGGSERPPAEPSDEDDDDEGDDPEQEDSNLLE